MPTWARAGTRPLEILVSLAWMVERTDKLRGANLVAGTLVRSHPGCGRYHSATKGEDYRDGRLKKPVISPPVTFDFFSALIRIRVHHTQKKKSQCSERLRHDAAAIFVYNQYDRMTSCDTVTVQ